MLATRHVTCKLSCSLLADAVDPYRISEYTNGPALLTEKWGGKFSDYAKNYFALLRKVSQEQVADLDMAGSSEFMMVADREIGLALDGTKSPKQALDDAAAEWTKIVDRVGRDQLTSFWQSELKMLASYGITYVKM